MTINRIHAGPVVFARILAAQAGSAGAQWARRGETAHSAEVSRASRRSPADSPTQGTPPSGAVGCNPQPVDSRNHLVKRFYQRHLYSLLRGSF